MTYTPEDISKMMQEKGERLDVLPLRQAIKDAEQVLEDVMRYDKTREEFKMMAYEVGRQDGSHGGKEIGKY